jgi:Flp pilus assembly protein TadG
MKALYISPDRPLTSRRAPSVRRLSRIRHPQSGQSLLELAFLVPLLLLLALGVIEVGRYAYIAILVGNAARAGTAYGTQSLPQSVDTVGITTAADNDFQNNGQNVGDLAITSSVSCGCDGSGTVAAAACTGVGAGTCASGHWVVVLSVTASGTFSSLFNYPGIPASITVSRTSSMRVALI